jgi:ATP-dependent Lon protease
MKSATDIPTIPGELFAKFQTSFYADPVDAVFKAMERDFLFRLRNKLAAFPIV